MNRAVLTGATGGIGRAIAMRLAPQCESLLLVGRDAARLAQLRREIGSAGGKCRVVAADLTAAGGREAVARAAAEAPGGIDLLINNAGAGEFAWLADQDDAALERMVRLNALAPMQLTRRLLPLLLAQPAARIVNVGSIFGHLGYPGYAASARRCAASSPTARCR
jgi:short-subunit dehydrogenase